MEGTASKSANLTCLGLKSHANFREALLEEFSWLLAIRKPNIVPI
jgi:hypothetical protein